MPTPTTSVSLIAATRTHVAPVQVPKTSSQRRSEKLDNTKKAWYTEAGKERLFSLGARQDGTGSPHNKAPTRSRETPRWGSQYGETSASGCDRQGPHRSTR